VRVFIFRYLKNACVFIKMSLTVTAEYGHYIADLKFENRFGETTTIVLEICLRPKFGIRGIRSDQVLVTKVLYDSGIFGAVASMIRGHEYTTCGFVTYDPRVPYVFFKLERDTDNEGEDIVQDGSDVVFMDPSDIQRFADVFSALNDFVLTAERNSYTHGKCTVLEYPDCPLK
jgi:hypothetical protein